MGSTNPPPKKKGRRTLEKAHPVARDLVRFESPARKADGGYAGDARRLADCNARETLGGAQGLSRLPTPVVGAGDPEQHVPDPHAVSTVQSWKSLSPTPAVGCSQLGEVRGGGPASRAGLKKHGIMKGQLGRDKEGGQLAWRPTRQGGNPPFPGRANFPGGEVRPGHAFLGGSCPVGRAAPPGRRTRRW